MQLSHVDKKTMQIYPYARFAENSSYIGQASSDACRLPKTRMPEVDLSQCDMTCDKL